MQQQMAMQQQMGGMSGTQILQSHDSTFHFHLIEAQIQSNQKLMMGGMSEWGSHSLRDLDWEDEITCFLICGFGVSYARLGADRLMFPLALQDTTNACSDASTSLFRTNGTKRDVWSQAQDGQTCPSTVQHAFVWQVQ